MRIHMEVDVPCTTVYNPERVSLWLYASVAILNECEIFHYIK
jgi:hypothetical protein